MKSKNIIFILVLINNLFSSAQDFDITNVSVKKDDQLKQLIFSIEVLGNAGDSVPTPIGSLDSAPVLGYVFPTTLHSYDVGFDTTSGIVALALTSHPDFDDTPIWDENLDAIYTNDGIIWHPHWVILENNTAVPGGFSVKETSTNSILPPTNPGMPMYMDSPGFPVTFDGNKIICTVPLGRVNNNSSFSYDAVTAYMQVNTSNSSLPMLGVYDVYDVASGSLTLPFSIGNHSCDTLFIDVSSSNGIGLINPEFISIFPNPTSDFINVELSAGFNLTQYEIKIFDMNGNQVFQNSLNNNSITIPISNIGSYGTYIIKVFEITSGLEKGNSKIVIN